MGQVSGIPHRRKQGMCPVNGIRDLIHWRAGRDWSNEFVYGLGSGGGFAYLRFRAADPPRQVYWGVATPRLHRYLAGLLGARLTETENRTFEFSWRKAQEAVDAGSPPVLGPLDMFHLRFYEVLYHRRHIPIHYLLLVGYDSGNAYALDTGQEGVQKVPLGELRLAWDVRVPGLGKRNRLAVLDVPQSLPPAEALIRRSIADQCQTMLHPPVSMVGIPAMRKVVREISRWPKELGVETAARSLRQVLEYLNSPPDLEGDHLTAGRDVIITFLQEAGTMAGFDLSTAISRLNDSMVVIPKLADAIRQNRLEQAAACFGRCADAEEAAYRELSSVVSASESAAP